MTHYQGPRPILRAETLVTIVRQADEECQNELDAAGKSVFAVALPMVTLPDGRTAQVVCKRAGDILSVQIVITPPARGGK